jgi:hypothetical protein
VDIRLIGISAVIASRFGKQSFTIDFIALLKKELRLCSTQ